MKLNKFTTGIAASLVSTAAYSHGPTVTPDMEVFVSGASAQDKALALLFTDLCVAGTLDTFKDNINPSKLGKAHTAFFCTVDASQVTGMSADQKVLFHKRSAGGSGMGVAPVADEVAIEAMAINNGNCSLITGQTDEWECTTTGAGDLTLEVSDAGISDVEPALFVAPNVPDGFSSVSAAQLDKLIVTSQTAVVFGIPVTTVLRNALQEAQGLTVGSDTEANMPSLSKSVVASLFNGGIRKWDEITVGGTALTSAVATAPSDTKVNVCRRVPGSGTQAQFNAKFTHVPCTSSTGPLESGNPFTGPIVTLNSGSGDVSQCLNDANTANKWAVGVQSTEKNMDLSDDFRFIKIDGVAPTIQNAANNTYFDWVENSIQWRKAANNGPSGDMLELLETIASNAGSPINVASLNTSFVHPWGQGGYLALNTNGHTPSFPFDINNPVATATHAASGAVNNCSVPQVNTGSEI